MYLYRPKITVNNMKRRSCKTLYKARCNEDLIEPLQNLIAKEYKELCNGEEVSIKVKLKREMGLKKGDYIVGEAVYN